MSLDELERAFIRAAQQELAPSPADRERHQAALLERLGGAGPSGGAAGGVGLEGARLGLAGAARSAGAARTLASLRESRLSMLGVGLVVGAVVGGWLGFGLGRSTTISSRPEAVASESANRAPPAREHADGEGGDPHPTLDARAADASAPAAAVDSAPEPPTTASEPDGKNAPRARTVARRSAAPNKPESSLARELAMLQRARRALNADNGRLALGIVEELDERYPEGVLIEERRATRVLSLCQLERLDEAKQAAEAFLERYSASVYAERVRKSCAAASRE